MAYDRYDERRGGRRETSGHREHYRGGDHERGFFERAGDEISSWFGDRDDDGGRRMRGERDHDRDSGRWFSGREEIRPERSYREEDRGRRGYRGRDHEGDEDRAWRPMNWSSSGRDYRQGVDRDRAGRDEYQPMAGNYGRHGDYGRREENRDLGRSSEWERDPYRRTSFAGSSARSNSDDAPYGEWRRRHMEELDRDYDQYRQENQSRFEGDFAGWREKREGKRSLLDRIREHMEVVGSDGEHVGTIDRVAGDRIILTRSDPDSDGVHHSISCTMLHKIEDDKVVLEMKADRAKERWRDESRERALFEREDQGRAGPGMLNRSFSGTYR